MNFSPPSDIRLVGSHLSKLAIVKSVVASILLLTLATCLMSILPVLVIHIKDALDTTAQPADAGRIIINRGAGDSLFEEIPASASERDRANTAAAAAIITSRGEISTLSHLVDEIVDVVYSEWLLIFAVVKLLALLLLHSCISCWGHIALEEASCIVDRELRSVAFSASLKLDWARRLSNENAVVLSSSLDKSIAGFVSAAADIISNLLPAVVSLVASLVAIYSISPGIAVFIAVSLIAFSLLQRFRRGASKSTAAKNSAADSSCLENAFGGSSRQKRVEEEKEKEEEEMEPSEERIQALHAKALAFFSGIIERMPTVLVYRTSQQLATERFAELQRVFVNMKLKMQRSIHANASMYSSTISVALIVSALVVVLLSRRGHFGLLMDFAVVGVLAKQSADASAAAYATFARSHPRIAAISTWCKLIREADEDSSRRLHHMSPTKSKPDRQSQAQQKDDCRGDDDDDDVLVTCEQVSGVQYGDCSADPVVKEVTFKPVKRGTVVLLRGVNGSSKSSFLRMLSGVVPHPTSGRLSVHGASSIVTLEQSPVLISGFSIFENITMHSQEQQHSQKERQRVVEAVHAAAKRVNIFDAINRLPRKFDTVIESGGGVGSAPLSGGELQRVAIARLLYNASGSNYDAAAGVDENNKNKVRKRVVVCLDEPDQNLDHQTQLLVREIVKEQLSKDAAVFIVTHHEQGWGDTNVRTVHFEKGVGKEK